jgi:hypothetical protein
MPEPKAKSPAKLATAKQGIGWLELTRAMTFLLAALILLPRLQANNLNEI